MAGSNATSKRKTARTRITSKDPLFPSPPAKTGPKGPWKMTEETVGKLRQAFAIDATVEEACFYAGINKTTWYEWVKKNPELSNEIEALRHTPVLTARQTVINAIKTDPDMAMKYLERKRKAEFSTKSEVDNTVKVVQPILDHIKPIDQPDVIDLT